MLSRKSCDGDGSDSDEKRNAKSTKRPVKRNAKSTLGR